MPHSNLIHAKVLALRRSKRSYSEIHNLTKVPKSTINTWLSHKEWSIQIKGELTQSHLGNNKLNLIKANNVLSTKKLTRLRKYIKEAQLSYRRFKNDPLFSFGLGIYWGEGDKKSGNLVKVTNTDPNMLYTMAAFYRKYLNLDERKLRIGLFIYKDIKQNLAINFWSKLLQVPKSQFIKVQVLESRAKLTNTKSKYGICCLYFSKTEFHIKIREWIRLLSLDLRV